MKAWSLAWNTAEVPLANARIIQVRRTGKGCLSYLVVSQGDALVIDASLPTEVYLSLAESHGVHIRYVLDTHVHADHLSRSKHLAENAGAELLLPAQNRVRFPHRAITAGTVLEIGTTHVQALSTPGHTMESTCYLLLDGEALFTGDTLFTSTVGRPDLHANTEQASTRASLLYRSVQQLFALGSSVFILPGHTSTPPPFDGVAIRERLDVIAKRLRNSMQSESAFVEWILSRIPPTPPNFEQIVEINEAGELPVEDVTELEAGANRCAVA
jgi:glyoxylase-like metal-dependent hydrolase (beta-lactamase superfamily II)